MCVIIDANMASAVFKQTPDEDFAPIVRWLSDPDRDGRLVYGGRLARELQSLEAGRRFLRVLQQAGRAILYPDEVVNAEEERITQAGLCRSNDHHVIALARVSGARTLCSRDQDLHVDFKNQRLIAKPRGSIYQAADHEVLLRHTSSCGQRRRLRRRGR